MTDERDDWKARALKAEQAADWRTEAVKWLRRKAEEQRATNEKHPRHAEAYPSWGERVRQFHWLADDLEREQESSPFGLDNIETPPQPAAQGPVKLRFPTMLRKMWSGGEVQDWLDRQGSLYTSPQPSAVPVVEQLVGALERLKKRDCWTQFIPDPGFESDPWKPAEQYGLDAIAAGQKFIKESGK